MLEDIRGWVKKKHTPTASNEEKETDSDFMLLFPSSAASEREGAM